MGISLQSSEYCACVCVGVCMCAWERPPKCARTHTHTHTHTQIPPCHRHHPHHPARPPLHCAPAAIDGVSELRGDVLINLDTLGIDLTSCCNDLLVFVKDHCLSGPQLMRRACLIVMETIITAELGCGSVFGSLFFSLCRSLSQSHAQTHRLSHAR